MTGVPPFRPLEIIDALARHEVLYVVIGGLAATLHGSPLTTGDADICPAADPDNLERLSTALRDLGARVHTVSEPEGLPFACEAETLAQARIWNLVTRSGRVDVSFEPPGTGGYRDLRRDVATFDVEGLLIPVASLADVIRSKEAAGRERDRQALPTLRRLLERLDEERRSGH
ncbi:MAG: hypothetical protein ACRDVM_10460 [Acidimicrobiia bacterium]